MTVIYYNELCIIIFITRTENQPINQLFIHRHHHLSLTCRSCSVSNYKSTTRQWALFVRTCPPRPTYCELWQTLTPSTPLSAGLQAKLCQGQCLIVSHISVQTINRKALLRVVLLIHLIFLQVWVYQPHNSEIQVKYRQSIWWTI